MHEVKQEPREREGVLAIDLGMKTLAVGVNEQGRVYHIGGFTGNRWYNKQNEWGLYTFVQMVRYKCVLYGKELVIVDERDTSKTCSGCGHKQTMPLWKRTYRCPNCRLVRDRDENSAVTILKRYFAWLRPHVPDGTRCAVVFTATGNVEYV